MKPLFLIAQFLLLSTLCLLVLKSFKIDYSSSSRCAKRFYFGNWAGDQFGVLTYVHAIPCEINMFAARLLGLFHISDDLFLPTVSENLFSQICGDNYIAQTTAGGCFCWCRILKSYWLKANQGSFCNGSYQFSFRWEYEFASLACRDAYRFPI